MLNIHLVHHPKPQDRQLQLERANSLLAWVEQEPDGHRRGLLRCLMGLLFTADSPLAVLPLEESFHLLSESLALIDQRRSDLALLRMKAESGKPDWLLVNAPDTSYALASLENLPPVRNGRLKLMAYLPLTVRREKAGIIGLGSVGTEDEREVLIVLAADSGEAIENAIRETLWSALQVTQDELALQARLDELAPLLPDGPEQELLDWLRKGAFMPFAYQRVDYSPAHEIQAVERLGISRLDDLGFAIAPTDEPSLLVRQTHLQSPLCRAEDLKLLGCRESLGEGAVRIHRFLGLLDVQAQRTSALAVPGLQRKISRALDSLSIPPGCYDYQRIAELFNAFPKLELFSTPEEAVYLIARSLLSYLASPGRIKLVLLASPDPDVFVLIGLIAKPLLQDKGLPDLGHWLASQIPAELESTQTIRASADHAGLYWCFKQGKGEIWLDLELLEKGLNRLIQSWEQRFRRFLRRAAGDESGLSLVGRYYTAFPVGYRESTPPELAARDVMHLERAIESGRDDLELWKSREPGNPRHLLRIYSLRSRFLDELLPLLGKLGLRVADHVPYVLEVKGMKLSVASLSIQPAQPQALPLMAVKKNLLEAFGQLLAGYVESDELNELLLLTGLDWQAIDIFRGYRNYYLQLGGRLTRERFHQSLLHNPQTASLLYRYFDARFNPSLGSDLQAREEETLGDLRMEIAAALNAVADSSEDRILRDLFNLIDATLRTNHYCRRSQKDYFLAFKISSLGVLNMPTPAPLFEIYVHSATMEGIHLRGAKVARGGIRWSDRPDDFRAEILGLQKTQTLKNALIVPHGAKGGFIVKTPYAQRAEGIRLAGEAYATLMRGLLDLTDNRGPNDTIPPPKLIAYDSADPYLVVAADKGTAHLSDTANAIASEYGFWLGDAFASGGSRGYDHKALGITARGAFECVRRHFRELGLDIDHEPFSVVGIGSMDGDVFGNGMLLSPFIRLKAAFGPKHIFIDPEPGVTAFQERQRLFTLPGSSWDDYDRSLISPGGGVFLREAKDIPLSNEVRLWLGVRHRSIDAEGLVRLLLTAPVDLLWLGGIGTFVKASTETHEQVGDRANDALRVDGNQLRAKIVGEGANLGFTQKGRIEFALAGGKINTDAVDNSGGVDLSDHEVNLKILMAALQALGVMTDEAARDEWLKAMTGEVCAQVIANNRLQSLCLSLDSERCKQDVEPFLEVASRLGQADELDRAGEAFPSRKDVLARPAKTLSRPELAVLMLHSKLALKQALLQSPDFLTEAKFKSLLASYFPKDLRERHGEVLAEHSLAREITATVLTNTLINQAGCGFLSWVDELESASLALAAQAYLDFDDLLGGPSLRNRIYELRGALSTEHQYAYRLKLEATLAEQCRWALGLGKADFQADNWPGMLQQYLDFLAQGLEAQEQAALGQSLARLEQGGFTTQQAIRLALMDHLGGFPLLADLAFQTQVDFTRAVKAYTAMAEALSLTQIDAQLDQPAARDRWERRLQTQLKQRFRLNLIRFSRILLETESTEPEPFLKQRLGRVPLERWQRLQRELNGVSGVSILPYASLSTELERLVELCEKG